MRRRGNASVNALASTIEMKRFRAAIGQQIGLRFDDAKLDFLGEVLQRRLREKGWGSDTYLRALEYQPTDTELAALARELTIGETYFFRNNEQFRALAEAVLPERMRKQATVQTLRLLSAGCSSGEEAYSMAIVARETVVNPSWTISIRAVDLNPAALERARCARYSPWALRGTSIEMRTKWFRDDGRDVVLDNSLRSMVSFEQANLASDDCDLWQVATYDAIFCRNVLMYFEPQQIRAVVARIAQSLAPGGYLFLGHAETLRGVSDRFRLCNTHETFYYQLIPAAELDCEQVAPFMPRERAPQIANLGQDVSWFDEIRLASERIAALVPFPAPADASGQKSSVPFDPGPALELLRQERFAEALAHIHARPKAAERNPDVLLLEATLLAHSGQLAAADEVASRLLLIDERNAGAHYVLALCREHAGLRDRAAEHHRAAGRCDPSFAMSRLHLGLLARRAGDRDAARHEFARALVLLEHEDASRLLLFGGGFSREALVALCESALKECGGMA
jgi:chemotaxis protein methyltransferase CheR